jgi:ketosteroid isomerase-like protein
VPDAGVYRGHEGWFEWIANWSAAWEDFGFEVEDYIAAGDGRVILATHLWARGRSGITLERDDGWLWTLRHGKAVRLEYYAARAEALEAAGVSGPSA